MPYGSWRNRSAFLPQAPSLLLALALAGTGLAGVAQAQTTGTAVFLSPYRSFQRSELAGYFSDPGPGFVVEGSYRYGTGGTDLGLRLGVGDNDVDVPNGPSSTFFVAGFDFRQRIVRHTEDFPMDGALILGVGGIFGDGFSSGIIPVAVSLGRRVELEGTRTSFVPYVEPVIAATFGDTEDDVLFGIGLGVDITFSRRVEGRIGAGLGDFDGISLGISFLR